MKYATYYFGISVLVNSITLVFNFCASEGRNESGLIADDLSWYEPAIFNISLNDCECGVKYTCIRKCCDVNYVFTVFNDSVYCVFNNKSEFKVDIFEYRTTIIEDDSVKRRFISGVSPCVLREGEHDPVDLNLARIQKDGRLWLAGMDTYFEYDHYCIERYEDGEDMAFYCILDYDVQGLEISERLTVIGMLISLPFLLITFIVYAILPLRNLHGQSLMCYVFSLFSTYFLFVCIYFYPNSDEFSAVACRSIAMLFYYFFVASFFWMNVMCIDIYLTFSGSRGFPGTRKRTERRRFLVYSAYAWGSPLVLVLLVMAISITVKPNRWYNPGVTDQQCWLNDGIPTFIYLYLPMAILIVANIVLFAITACKIRQVQQDTAMLRKGDSRTSRSDDEKIRFGVYVKLFLAMGVNWSLEIIAWAIDWQVERVPPAVWYVTEFCNAAFGVFIFFIFVFKKKIWKLLKIRYYEIRRRVPPPDLKLTPTDSSSCGNTRSSGNK